MQRKKIKKLSKRKIQNQIYSKINNNTQIQNKINTIKAENITPPIRYKKINYNFASIYNLPNK